MSIHFKNCNGFTLLIYIAYIFQYNKQYFFIVIFCLIKKRVLLKSQKINFSTFLPMHGRIIDRKLHFFSYKFHNVVFLLSLKQVKVDCIILKISDTYQNV